MFAEFITDSGAEGISGAAPQPSGFVLQPPVRSVDAVKSIVQRAVQEVLGSTVGDDQPLMAAGLDSLGTVELRNALESRLGLRLPPTLIFDFPTVIALTGFVGSRIAAAAPTVQEAQSARQELGALPALQAAPARAGHQLPVQDPSLAAVGNVAVVSVAQRLPGGSSTINMLKATDTVSIVPYSYWDSQHATRHAGELQASFGSFLPGDAVTAFDPAAFSLPVAEALLIDPQQRLLMEVAAEALSGTQAFAALDATVASGKNEGVAAAYRAQCGVFVGVSSRDYFTLGKQYSQVGL
jgi:acyl carrier protein